MWFVVQSRGDEGVARAGGTRTGTRSLHKTNLNAITELLLCMLILFNTEDSPVDPLLAARFRPHLSIQHGGVIGLQAHHRVGKARVGA
jgi:hypothetical protein